jgi:peptidyl-prolyl cis-trans isomerase D
VRGFGRQRDTSLSNAEVNRRAWEAAAALEVAETLRLTATDDEVRQTILREFSDPSSGGFNMAVYERILRDNGLTPEMFEAYMKRRISLMKVHGVLAGSGNWVAPAELESALNDVTDKLMVKIAYYTDKDAAKVKITDADIETYYKENTNSIALPDTMSVKYVKYVADAPARLAQFKPTEDELRDHYDATSSRFETSTTNGVITKKFEEVKGSSRRSFS